jgi:AcrR family transcriptional regulator
LPAEIPKEKMFDAAVDAVIQHGYAGATTKRIAEIAGVGEATLFRRFGTKEALLREALRAEAAAFASEAVVYSGDLRADLVRIVRAYDAVLKRRGRLAMSVLAELPRRPELGEVMAAPMAAVGHVAGVVGRYQSEGALGGEKPWDALVPLLSPVLLGSALRKLQPAIPEAFDAEAHVERFLTGWAWSS